MLDTVLLVPLSCHLLLPVHPPRWHLPSPPPPLVWIRSRCAGIRCLRARIGRPPLPSTPDPATFSVLVWILKADDLLNARSAAFLLTSPSDPAPSRQDHRRRPRTGGQAWRWGLPPMDPAGGDVRGGCGGPTAKRGGGVSLMWIQPTAKSEAAAAGQRPSTVVGSPSRESGWQQRQNRRRWAGGAS